jgi:N-acetylmuramoyl-L-alanine amidase
VLGIAHYHRDYNGWNDIGYNFLVDRYGQVFEGRAGGIENAVIGAHAQGYNSYSTGVACLGTFTNVTLPAAAMDALARLIGWKLSLHGVPVLGEVTLSSMGGADNRYRSGTDVVFQRVSGHRDGDATSCPGNALYGQLGTLRTRANGYSGPINGITVTTSAYQRGARPVALAGVLHFADGSSPAGATLSIEYTTAGSAWTPVASAPCGADGAWTASAVLPSSGSIRAVFAGDATRPPVQSPAVPVTVVPALSLTSATRRTTAGGSIAVSGAVFPAPARVTVTLQRLVGRRWVRVSRRSVAVAGGRYASSVRLSRRGLYRVVVTAPGASRTRQLRAV